MTQDGKHGGLQGAMDQVKDAVGGMVGKASASTVSSYDAESFVASAGIGDLYEIEAGASRCSARVRRRCGRWRG